MELNAFKRLKNYTIQIEDEEIGQTADFIIDIKQWAIRAVRFKRGVWPFTSRMEVPVENVDQLDHDTETIKLDITQKILDDPTQNPIKNMGNWLTNLFRWGTFRYENYYQMPAEKAAADVRAMQAARRPIPHPDSNQSQAQLSNLKRLVGFIIRTRDGERIRVRDFILDFSEQTPRIRYFLVGKGEEKAFLPVEWIEEIDRSAETMAVMKSGHMVLNGPYAIG